MNFITLLLVLEYNEKKARGFGIKEMALKEGNLYYNSISSTRKKKRRLRKENVNQLTYPKECNIL